MWLRRILLIRDVLRHQGAFGFNLQITLWLWFTVLFANFAEAMAEGRGKAQADSLRKARAETIANRLMPDGKVEQIASSKLRAGDSGRELSPVSSFPSDLARFSRAWLQSTSQQSPENPRL